MFALERQEIVIAADIAVRILAAHVGASLIDRAAARLSV
jgi:hypothetical protein